jgi:hypothetical protein
MSVEVWEVLEEEEGLKLHLNRITRHVLLQIASLNGRA